MQLTDPKGRSHLITLRAGASFHTHRGMLNHDEIIGGPDGNVVRSQGGTPYVVLRPLLADYTLAMKRGAAVVYPKDAAQVVAFADVFPGARVLEAGALARTLEPDMVLSADLSGMALLEAIHRAPATEYLLVEPSGQVYGVLAARDVDRAFAGV